MKHYSTITQKEITGRQEATHKTPDFIRSRYSFYLTDVTLVC